MQRQTILLGKSLFHLNFHSYIYYCKMLFACYMTAITLKCVLGHFIALANFHFGLRSKYIFVALSKAA